MRLIKILGACTILVSSFMTLESLGWTVVDTRTDPSNDVWKLKESGSNDGKLSKNGNFFKQYDSYWKRGAVSRTRVHGINEARTAFTQKCSN